MLYKTVSKLTSMRDINYSINRLNRYIRNKNSRIRMMSFNIFIYSMMLNQGYTVDKASIIMGNDSTIKETISETRGMEEILNTAKENAIFKEYKKRAQVYLSQRVYKGTPMTSDMFVNGAKNAYRKYGILVPIELALAQAQLESGFGKNGLSSEKNPFNVGEFDDGTKITFDSTEDGVNAYFNLMAKDYLGNKDIDGLLKDFTNGRGYRYASNKDYEKILKHQIAFDTAYIDKEISAEK